MKTLAAPNLRVGLQIKQIAHPEYGVWTILGRAYDNDDSMWIVRGSTGAIVLDVGELCFWSLAA